MEIVHEVRVCCVVRMADCTNILQDYITGISKTIGVPQGLVKQSWRIWLD